jgi:hypothetical protein
MNTKKMLTKIVVIDENNHINSLQLCLQSLLANVDIRYINIDIYTKKSKEIIDSIHKNLLINTNIKFYEVENCNYLKIMTETVYDLEDNYSGIVLLTDKAIVSSGWLLAMQEAAERRDDIAVVISREIRHENDRQAWDLVPYAMNSYDIDVALCTNTDIKINLQFDEENGLISLTKFSLFCTYFSQNVFNRIQWHDYYPLSNNFFIDELSYIINKLNMYIVFTEKSKIFHVNYFS